MTVERQCKSVAAESTPNSEQQRVEAELRDRARQAELGAAIGRALTTGETLRTQLQRSAEALVEHLDAAFARFWTLNDAEGMLELQASAGLYTHLDGPHGRVPVGAFKIGLIAEERTPHLSNDVLADERISDPEWARREGMLAFAGYPLLIDERLVGVMGLFARQPLPERTLNLLASIADIVAVAIDRDRVETERGQLLLQERAARDDLETIYRVAQAVSAQLDRAALVQMVTDAATSLTGAQLGAFFYNLVDERGESYTLYALSGVPPEAFAGFPMPRNTAIFGPVFRGEGVVRLDDVLADPRYGNNPPFHGMPDGHPPVRSFMAVPVISRDAEVLGGLFFGHAQPAIFTERAERLVRGITSQAAIALDNARLYEQVQDAVRTRDEFLAAAAHDLKTPLTSVKGMTQLLLRSARRDGPLRTEQIVSRLERIDITTSQMVQQIDEMVDLTQLRMGQPLHLNRLPTDLVALVRRVTSQQQQTTDRHHLRVEATTSTLTGQWDATRLGRAIGNLLSNAIKYSPAGGEITVTIAPQDRDGTPFAIVAVRDNGVGIPPADLSRIFERFQRASNVIGQIDGAGIGLASTRQIVEQHGGTISVSTSEGTGSTFTLRLPLAAPPAPDIT